ncbi:Pre-rRNA-processing protein las1 [Porphyridium purpureum]|uniref:Pre-rRNA-processing protein las1 n=1 Tax=Porphyridium purpureum TaxID=35688 RepID=A0A5J4Z8M9_PORPP|nr:Pre-rRNA-processing protein las1 [Porphyridium purpureum]|eukprot:POR4134..scf295_1
MEEDGGGGAGVGETHHHHEIREKAHVVAWQTWDEWEPVCRAFVRWDSDAALAMRAVRTVRAWRSSRGLPLIVDTTAQLVELLLMNDCSETSLHSDAKVSSLPPHATRLALALALTRFVNGLTEHHQRGKYARSVAMIAKGMDLPPLLVELRHDATHKTLPSLDALRFASRQCVRWMIDKYWLPQAERVDILLLADSFRPMLASLAECVRKKRSRRKVEDQLAKILGVCSEYRMENVLVPLLVKEHLCLAHEDDSILDARVARNRFDLAYAQWAPLLIDLSVWRPGFGRALVMYILEAVCSGGSLGRRDQKWVGMLWLQHLLGKQSLLLVKLTNKNVDQIGAKLLNKSSHVLRQLLNPQHVLLRLCSLSGGEYTDGPPAELTLEVAINYLNCIDMDPEVDFCLREMLKCAVHGNLRLENASGGRTSQISGEPLRAETVPDTFVDEYERKVRDVLAKVQGSSSRNALAVQKSIIKRSSGGRAAQPVGSPWRLEEAVSVEQLRRQSRGASILQSVYSTFVSSSSRSTEDSNRDECGSGDATLENTVTDKSDSLDDIMDSGYVPASDVIFPDAAPVQLSSGVLHLLPRLVNDMLQTS